MTKNKNNARKVVTSMGRRETISERERRIRRLLRHEEYSASKRQQLSNSLESDSNEQSFSVLDTPSWFTNDDDVDVSIIVPMYKSRKVIERQIKEWSLEENVSTEIIYVDDLCPLKSFEIIVPTWERRKQQLQGKKVGKIITSHVNRGYGPNCNLGAKFAKGKYLIFLNADVFVLPNWIHPMVELIESNPKIGIVGNLQIQSHSPIGAVDSAGSEFNWKTGTFEHIGRLIHKGIRLSKPMSHNNMPSDLCVPSQREMVTGCCFMIPKKIFMEIGGYDEAYKIGYWEDSDMNMAVQEKGYEVYFQPKSKVLHVGGHTKANGHKLMKQNRSRFFYRWVETGILDKFVNAKRPPTRKAPDKMDLKSAAKGKVVGCIIACNEEEFLEASVRSISPLVDRFVFVIGGNQYALKAGMCDEKGYPKDNTLEIAKSLAEEFDSIVIEPPNRIWKDKTEMRNSYVPHISPDEWMFMLDGDEVYKENQLWLLTNLMQFYECLTLNFYTFWNNIETVGTGSWDQYPQERLVKWKNGYHYKSPNHLFVVDKNGQRVNKTVPTYSGRERLFYHYSWVRPLNKIKQKLEYYNIQLREEWGKNDIAKNYIEDVFLKWRNDPKSVRSTHPRGGGGACPFAGIHPYEVLKLIEQGKLRFE